MKRPDTVWLSLIGLTVLLTRIALFWTPTLRDEGMFGYMAQEVLRGHLPFSTAIDNKGALLYFEMALPLAIFGETSMAGIRFFGTLFILGTLFALYRLGVQLLDHRSALIGVALYAFHIGLVGMQGHYYGSEVFALLPMVLSVLFGWKGFSEKKNLHYLVAGVFLGLAVWTRPTAVLQGLLFVLFLLVAEEGKRKFLGSLWGVVGALLASLPFLGLYLWAGQFPLLVEAHLTYSAVWLDAGALTNPPLKMLGTVLKAVVPHTLFLVAVFFWSPALYRKDDPRRLYLVLWLAVSVLIVLSPRQYLIKHMHQLLPPLCLAAGSLVKSCWDEGVSATRRAIVLGALGLSLVVALSLDLPRYVGLIRDEAQHTETIIYKADKLSQWLRENSQPGDGVYEWGVEWEVYFESGLRSPTRHVNLLFIIMMAISVDRGLPFAADLERTQDEIMESLQTNPPKFILATAKVDNYGLSRYNLPQRFETFLGQHYDFAFRDEPFYVFLRKDASDLPEAKQPE